MNTRQSTTTQLTDGFSFKMIVKTPEYSNKRGTTTQTPGDTFKQGLDLLFNQLDNLMKIFKRRDPQFYQGYILARTIVDD